MDKKRREKAGQALMIAALAAFLGMVGPDRSARAEVAARMPAPVAALIDVQRILQESLASKSVQKQIDAYRARFQTETEGEENELRRAEQELVKARATIPAEAYADREQQLRQRFLTVERHVDARRKALDKVFTDSMDAVRTGLLDVVQTLARERGVNLVLIKQQTLWADKALDVTDEVLMRLNKKVPQISVRIAPVTDKDK